MSKPTRLAKFVYAIRLGAGESPDRMESVRKNSCFMADQKARATPITTSVPTMSVFVPPNRLLVSSAGPRPNFVRGSMNQRVLPYSPVSVDRSGRRTPRVLRPWDGTTLTFMTTEFEEHQTHARTGTAPFLTIRHIAAELATSES